MSKRGRPSKLAGPGSPRLGRFDSFAASSRTLGRGRSMRDGRSARLESAGRAEAVAALCRRSGEPFLVGDEAQRGCHPGALVQAERARVCGVDAEPDVVITSLPEAAERVAEQPRRYALPAPPATCEELLNPAAAVRIAGADRSGGNLVRGAHDAPERRIETLASKKHFGPPLKGMRRVLPVVREGFLLRSVKVARVALRIKCNDAKAVRPLGRGRRSIQLDTQLAEHAHGAIAERLKQSAARCVGFPDTALDRACAAFGCMLLEFRRDHLPDPPPDRARVNIPLGGPALASLSDRAIANNPVTNADDTRVLLQIDV